MKDWKVSYFLLLYFLFCVFKMYFIIFTMYMGVVGTHDLRWPQRLENALAPLELELWGAVSCPAWVLGTELRSCIKQSQLHTPDTGLLCLFFEFWGSNSGLSM